ncbi:MAG TPA: DUF2851 family protein [Ohtaekwangia sp.]
MSESFLHYLWQCQYFNKSDLRTTTGDPVSVFNAGLVNIHAGPDFHNARLQIGEMIWVGNVEIHVESSGWMAHGHHMDQAYDNVVLHVVWQDNKPVRRIDGSLLPTVELKGRVEDELLRGYKRLVNSPEKIPCAGSLHDVPEMIKLFALDKVLTARLESKSDYIIKLLQRNNQDWEETCYQQLALNFGFKVNADPFLQLAQSIPYKILMKHADKPEQIEALLFGQAGFLGEDVDDEYFRILRREYNLLQKKFSLQNPLNKFQWKFLRLRPANFPTIRIAQFASLISSVRNVFSRIVKTEDARSLRSLFTIQQSPYWKHHYQFEQPVNEELSGLGEMSIDNIIINTVVPVMTAYGQVRDDHSFVDRAVSILQQLPPESNTITRHWEVLGITTKTAFDSQALIELNNSFCSKRRCLDCSIGAFLMKPHGD